MVVVVEGDEIFLIVDEEEYYGDEFILGWEVLRDLGSGVLLFLVWGLFLVVSFFFFIKGKYLVGLMLGGVVLFNGFLFFVIFIVENWIWY